MPRNIAFEMRAVRHPRPQRLYQDVAGDGAAIEPQGRRAVTVMTAAISPPPGDPWISQ